jgi:hypothetical protein
VNDVQHTLQTALALGHHLSHGVLALCSTLLLSALLERALFLTFRPRRANRPLPAQARGLYGAFAWVGGIAPMAGLLGTVTGIMQSFAGSGEGRPDQAQLMAGIGFALTATAIGLLLAMGAFSGRALFGRRTDELIQAAARRVA